jgi:hypothetical protein
VAASILPRAASAASEADLQTGIELGIANEEEVAAYPQSGTTSASLKADPKSS